VKYLGRGDHHDKKYDHLEISIGFNDIHTYSVKASKYLGEPFDTAYCPYTFHTYPSEDNEDDYLSVMPIVLTTSVVGVFIFVSLVFSIYDFMVERRQRIVLDTAQTTSTIVSSLFPENVKEKLLEATRNQTIMDDKSTKNSSISSRHYKNKNIMSTKDGKNKSDTNSHYTVPLAESYPNTTIFFGDIAGFTAWSNAKEPTEVFMLLETIYSAFDHLAMRHHVFKVETIGDCYVAVTGVVSFLV
jgi:Adenylate and Guanylate cyclase catalytic domain